MVHAKIKKHPQMFFMRERIESYKKEMGAHYAGEKVRDVEALPNSRGSKGCESRGHVRSTC